MRRIFSWLSRDKFNQIQLPLRRIMPMVLVGALLFVSANNGLLAANQPLRPDPTSVKLRNVETNDQARNQPEGFVDNIRQKLNLDEPLYPPTKELLDSAKDTTQQTTESTQEAFQDASSPAETRSR